MKIVNISKVIYKKRKEKRITQEELAEYMGVSKASVSKWETEQSYPDIMLLPRLAAYFNISIDSLMGYSPQMTEEDIKKLYEKLSVAFSKEPMEKVTEQCEDVIREYYACFPLLYHMALLYTNHHMLAKSEEERKKMLDRAVELCERVKEEGDDWWLSREANSLQAMVYLIMQEPEEVIEVLEEQVKPNLSDEICLANAYCMRGNVDKAKEILQFDQYQHLLQMLGDIQSSLLLYVSDVEMFEEMMKRVQVIADTYQVDKLNPNAMAQIYLVAAMGYMQLNRKEEAMDQLEAYVRVCHNFEYPVRLRGDSYFTLIEDRMNEFGVGTISPRGEDVIRESIASAVLTSPAFAPLAEENRYQDIVTSLKDFTL